MANFSDILGINARHLLFIKKYNPDNAIIFADDKLKTKRFLEARGIPVPKLLGVIRAFKELDHYPLHTLPGQIVIKPNSSSGGEGIIVLGEKVPEGFRKSSGDIITLPELKRHINDILSGAFSKSGIGDICLIEKRIVSHERLAAISYKGLPDIRIIVFNMIPVMAMLRLPTPLSDGKANMHMGGVGAGIDIAKGEITYLCQFNKIVDEIPGIGELRGYKIPFWEDILKMAVKTQMVTDVGYLGVDIALDRNGPLLLEMNARAGLGIQIANMAPLRKRLSMVQKLKVKSIEKGIRLAKDLFGRQIDRDIEQVSGKTVVGNKEYITFYFKEGKRELLAKINPSLLENYIDSTIFNEISRKKPHLLVEEETLRIKFSLTDEKRRSIFKPMELTDKPYQVIIGRRELKGVLIDPYKYKMNELPDTPVAIELLPILNTEESKAHLEVWKTVDNTLARIEATIKKYFSLQPINYKSELERFIELKGKYNPLFIYKDDEKTYKELRKELHDLDIDDSQVQGKIFEAKRQELLIKLDLLHEAGKDPDKFTELSQEYFIKLDPHTLELAQKEVEKKQQILGSNLIPKNLIGEEHIKKEIYSIFKKYRLKKWNVVVKEHSLSRISVAKSKKRHVYLLKGTSLSKDTLDMVLAHEVETHVLRLENGLQQPYQIFTQGLAGYLLTEEGLAIYNQIQKKINPSLKEYTPALNYIKTFYIINSSFEESTKYVLERNFVNEEITESILKNIFRSVFRIKRGIGDTSQKGGYTKDLVYFAGYRKIIDFVEAGGNLKNLYYGKISLESLDDVSFMEEVVEPKILPDFY